LRLPEIIWTLGHQCIANGISPRRKIEDPPSPHIFRNGPLNLSRIIDIVTGAHMVGWQRHIHDCIGHPTMCAPVTMSIIRLRFNGPLRKMPVLGAPNRKACQDQKPQQTQRPRPSSAPSNSALLLIDENRHVPAIMHGFKIFSSPKSQRTLLRLVGIHSFRRLPSTLICLIPLHIVYGPN